MKTNYRFKSLLLTFLFFFAVLAGPLAYGAHNPDLDEVTRLKALGKVWGFLKYYHPEVAKGEIDWDQVLIDTIPAVKGAVDYDSFNQEIDNLIIAAGDVSNGFNAGVPAHPNEALFKWLKDKKVFSSAVVKKLTTLQKKHKPAENYWVSAAFDRGNATFDNEKPYNQPYYPDENMRMLALYRYWNAVQYFFAYHDDMDQDWDTTLEEFIPRFLYASDPVEYALAAVELGTRLNDSHGVVYGGYVNWYFGYYQPAVEARYIDGKTVVIRTIPSMMEPGSELKVGDIILKTHNTGIDNFRTYYRKYVAASNESVVNRELCDLALRGKYTELPFTVDRGGQVLDISVKCHYTWDVYYAFQDQDALLEKWKILPGNIGYVNMGIIQQEDVVACMTALMNTKAIIFDSRNYPNSTIYYFTYYLIPTPTPFVTFTYPNLDYPGQFDNYEEDYTSTWEDNPDYYKGRVVILMDERTQSQAEFTIMALQTAPDATTIGSQTSGADGNVCRLQLPGYIYTVFTGMGVFYPDGTPTQRIGIVPDILSTPTVAGIRAGKDEVLERAISFIEDNR